METEQLSKKLKDFQRISIFQREHFFLPVPEVYHIKNTAVNLFETWQKEKSIFKSPNILKNISKFYSRTFILDWDNSSNIPSDLTSAAVTETPF